MKINVLDLITKNYNFVWLLTLKFFTWTNFSATEIEILLIKSWKNAIKKINVKKL
jgi:hypothetical protein